MRYDEYLEIITQMPKIFPCIDINVVCDNFANDEWYVDIICNGNDMYGNYSVINETTSNIKEFYALLTRINKWARSNINLSEELNEQVSI